MASDKQNLQDAFLNHVRKTKVPVTIFLVNGVKLQGRDHLVRQLLRPAASRRPVAARLQARHLDHHALAAHQPPRRRARALTDDPALERDPRDRRPGATRALVLHPEIVADRHRREAGPALAEAVSLANALPELRVVGAEIVPVREARPGTLFGPGKLEELRERIEREEVELVLVDGPVTPVQQRNLERAWKAKLLDRTGLILEIFSDRAATREGRAPGRDGRPGLPAHAAGARLDPSGAPEGRPRLRRRARRDPDRGRPPRHRRADGPTAPPARQDGAHARAAPRGARQGALSRGGARVGYTKRGQVHALQPPDRRRSARRGHAVRHARPDDARGPPAGGGST